MAVRRSKRIWFVVLGVFVMVFSFTFLVQKFKDKSEVDAANMSAFDPGYIISDYQMSNYSSMSEEQVQDFLWSKGRCWNTNFSSVGTRVNYFSDSTPPTTWHVKDGHTVCLAEENIHGKTAARIIWEAAQHYRINPQVLIVLLQKETGLITDPIPNSWDYKRATGYGCPDSVPGCSSDYAGFENQIWYAAALFRNVLDNGYSKYPVGGAWVQWSTHSECGSGWVDIKNRATSALYRYTPYQPNAAALSSSYGTGDYCSQYGNRNFYSYFEDWFGGIKDTQSSTKIYDGVYYIRVAANKNMVLDVKEGSAVNGTNVQLHSADNTDAQKWKLTYNSVTDDYSIVNVATQKALDVDSASVQSGTNIQLWESNGTCAQRWKIVETGGIGVRMISACSAEVMDISNGSMKDGANVQIWDYNKTDAQKWELMPTDIVEDGIYTISSAINNNKKIDISGGAYGAEDGTNIQIWDKNDTTAQRWYVERDGNGYYIIKNMQSNKVLDVKTAGTKNWTNVQAWEFNGTCAQRWKILKSGDNYVFISNCSYKVLDLAEANTSRGSNIHIYEANNTKAQKWKLEPIAKIKNGDYVIVSKLSDKKAMDISGNNSKRGTNIQLYDANGTSAQKWNITYDKKTDTYIVFNKGVNKALDVESAGRVSGTNVQTWDKNNTCAQRWTIVKTGNEYVFYSACSGLVLDVSKAGIVNSTNIQIYSANGTAAQKWVLKEVE